MWLNYKNNIDPIFSMHIQEQTNLAHYIQIIISDTFINLPTQQLKEVLIKVSVFRTGQ